MKFWPVAPFFHSLLESGNIQNIEACHFFTAVQEKGQPVRVSFRKKLLFTELVLTLVPLNVCSRPFSSAGYVL